MLFLLLSFGLCIGGALLYILPQAESQPGIKNNGVFFNPMKSRGWTGVLFGYYIMSPIMISFLANYRISDMISNEFDITSYVGTVVGVVIGCGVLFQLPIVIFFLTKIGIVTPAFLRQYRKHAIVIILVIGAVVTPTADPLSQSLISIPLYILYEISILISAGVKRTKERMEAEALRNEQQ